MERISVDADFAEGIAVLKGQLYQLTWKTQRVLIYTMEPLRHAGEFKNHYEGWGLASDGECLLASAGSSTLRRYDARMVLDSARRVRARGLPLRHLNDLEVANGRIYANLWYTVFIAEIDQASYRVSRLIDCSKLVEIEAPDNPHRVLNGIAFNPSTNTLFLTGKNWRFCFEVSLPDS